MKKPEEVESQPLTEHSEDSHQQHTPLTKEEKFNTFVLYVLYLIQGFPIGFFAGAMPAILAEKGASYVQLSELSLAIIPFTFKFLTAPILDTYYSKKFGQRKTYIIPLQIIYSILVIYFSFNIQQLIDEQNIGKITILGFVLCFIMAQQDVAVDGWVLTMLSESHASIGATCNSVGQLSGVFVSNVVFILLNSTKFCNSYIYSIPQEEPLLSAQNYLIYSGVFTLVVTLLIAFFVKEKNAKADDHNDSIWDVLKCLKGFFTNKNLKWLLLIICTYKLGFSPISGTFSIELIKEGYSKESLANMSTLLIVVTFVVSIYASKKIKKGQEMSHMTFLYKLRILDSMYMYAVLKIYPYFTNPYAQYILILSSQVSTYFVQNFNFVAQGSFFNRISDLSVGGSYLTVMNSISNFGGQYSDSFAMFLVGEFNYDLVVICGFIFSSIFIFLMGKKWNSLQDIPKSAWKISQHKDEKKK